METGQNPETGPVARASENAVSALLSRPCALCCEQLERWFGPNVVAFCKRNSGLCVCALLAIVCFVVYDASNLPLRTAAAPAGYASLLQAGSAEEARDVLHSWRAPFPAGPTDESQ